MMGLCRRFDRGVFSMTEPAHLQRSAIFCGEPGEPEIFSTLSWFVLTLSQCEGQLADIEHWLSP